MPHLASLASHLSPLNLSPINLSPINFGAGALDPAPLPGLDGIVAVTDS